MRLKQIACQWPSFIFVGTRTSIYYTLIWEIDNGVINKQHNYTEGNLVFSRYKRENLLHEAGV